MQKKLIIRRQENTNWSNEIPSIIVRLIGDMTVREIHVNPCFIGAGTIGSWDIEVVGSMDGEVIGPSELSPEHFA